MVIKKELKKMITKFKLFENKLDYKVIKVKDYIEEGDIVPDVKKKFEKLLLNKYIFLNWPPLSNNLVQGLVTDIRASYNNVNSKFLLSITLENRNEYLVGEGRKIIVYDNYTKKTPEFREDDPYGEEDWGDTIDYLSLLREGVRWWKDGKLGPEEDDEPFEEKTTNFEVGDKVTVSDYIYYWNSGYGITPNIKEGNSWTKFKESDHEYIITHVSECEDLFGYTGQIIKLGGRWPWYQTTNFVKIS